MQNIIMKDLDKRAASRENDSTETPTVTVTTEVSKTEKPEPSQQKSKTPVSYSQLNKFISHSQAHIDTFVDEGDMEESSREMLALLSSVLFELKRQ